MHRPPDLLRTALHCDPPAHAVPHKHYRELQHAGCLSKPKTVSTLHKR